jgi:hydrogenase expression/formation protein HypE
MDEKMNRHGPPPFRLRAVLFDFDGTLTRPGALDFAAIKRELGCPADRYILEWIAALPVDAQRAAALAALETFELAAAAKSAPNEGAEELVRRLRIQGLKVGILTRNGLAAVRRALEQFDLLAPSDFDVIVTRDDDVRPKPAPDGVLHAAAAMGVAATETLAVGDYLLDMQAGEAANAVTAFLTNRPSPTRAPEGPGSGARARVMTTATVASDVDNQGRPDGADFVIGGLAELDEVVRLGLPLPRGKLPNELLARHLKAVTIDDPAVLVPAGVGEDVTALDVSRYDVIVAHGDPITLTSHSLGHYAVIVNANDIAASGGLPRWLLTTVLLPDGTTASEALALLADIAAAAAQIDVSIVGGHTEISPAVNRPVISATMLGAISRQELRDKHQAQPGDVVILTKALAVEGTALLAQELGELLRARGMNEAHLAACRHLIDRVSIVPEARLAAGFAGVRALHDVTEGGLATAVAELSTACRHGITVHRERLPILAETQRLCELLEADPLGLIGSGSLLICCRTEQADDLLQALSGAGIKATAIAVVGEPGAGVVALDHGLPAPWPEFAVDEAARLLQEIG